MASKGRELPALSIRRYGAIVSELASRKLGAGRTRRGQRRVVQAPPAFVGADYTQALNRVGDAEFAADFRFRTLEQARHENELRDCPKCGLGTKWWAFATSGSGDAWLLSGTRDGRSRVAFLDHDEESSATPRAMGIHLEQWFQLADLIGQVERAEDLDRTLTDSRHRTIPAFAKLLRARMNELSRGLVRKYPYAI